MRLFPFLGVFLWHICLDNRFKSSGGIILINSGLIKSWFCYVRDQNSTFPWFLDLWGLGNPYLGILIFEKGYCYVSGLPTICRFLKRRAPRNPEESFDEISKIMEMRPISIKKHEGIFANIGPISITKHKMTLLKFWCFRNQYFANPGGTNIK